MTAKSCLPMLISQSGQTQSGQAGEVQEVHAAASAPPSAPSAQHAADYIYARDAARAPGSWLRVVMPAGSWSPTATAAAGLDVGGVAMRALPPDEVRAAATAPPLEPRSVVLTFLRYHL